MNTIFNPKSYVKKTVCKTTGKVTCDMDYKAQKHWFKLEYPQGRICPAAIQIDEKIAKIVCRIYLDEESAEAISSSTIITEKAKFGKTYVHVAQFLAERSALTSAGYGFDSNGVRIQPPKPAVTAVEETPTQAPEVVEETASTDTTEQAEVIAIEEQPPNASAEAESVADELPQEPPSRFTADMPVENILASMTLAEANAVIVDIGTCKGWLLAEVLKKRPVSLRWYTTGYSGDNNLLRAGATMLLPLIPEQQAA
jgi:hypothetical protein